MTHLSTYSIYSVLHLLHLQIKHFVFYCKAVVVVPVSVEGGVNQAEKRAFSYLVKCDYLRTVPSIEYMVFIRFRQLSFLIYQLARFSRCQRILQYPF